MGQAARQRSALTPAIRRNVVFQVHRLIDSITCAAADHVDLVVSRGNGDLVWAPFATNPSADEVSTHCQRGARRASDEQQDRKKRIRRRVHTVMIRLGNLLAARSDVKHRWTISQGANYCQENGEQMHYVAWSYVELVSGASAPYEKLGTQEHSPQRRKVRGDRSLSIRPTPNSATSDTLR